MVILTQEVCGKEKFLYMDNTLHRQLTKKVIPSVQKKDFDWFVVVDGEEGSGKSVFAFQMAKVLDPNFTYEQIAFNATDFIRLVVKAKPHQCIVFDEAFTGLSSRSSLSEINLLLVSLMMEMRQKNLFIILVMPTFFMLDKYCILHRARGLFHVYMRKNKRGSWKFYTRNKMKYLYLKGKKFYEYNSVKPFVFGRFEDQYMVDEAIYRETKKGALHKKKRATKAAVYKLQRDCLIYGMYKSFFKSNKSATARYAGKLDLGLKRRVINEIIVQREEDLIRNSED